MKKFNSYINNNVLFNLANLNSVLVGLRIVAGILISKFIAIFVGVEGLAYVGNASNFLKSIQSLSVLGFYKGIVKQISLVKEDSEKLSEVLSTSFYIGLLSTVVSALGCYYFANEINNFLFGDLNYVYIIEAIALIVPMYALNVFSFSIMNGFSKYKMLLIINITGQICGLLIALLLIWQEQLDGALMALVITPGILFLITVTGILFRRNLMPYIKITSIKLEVLTKLSPYSMMALTSAVALPFIFIFIRNTVISTIGLKEAGYWEAMNRISDYYLMFVNSFIALYLVPKLTKTNTKKAFKHEVGAFCKGIMPYFLGLLILIFLCRYYVVTLIFSQDFLPTKSLFLWQILGDIARVLAMVFAYQFLAKKMFSHFIIIEIFLFSTLYFTSIYLLEIFGLEGVVIAHFVTYLLYFLIVLLVFHSTLFGVITEDSV